MGYVVTRFHCIKKDVLNVGETDLKETTVPGTVAEKVKKVTRKNSGRNTQTRSQPLLHLPLEAATIDEFACAIQEQFENTCQNNKPIEVNCKIILQYIYCKYLLF